MVLVITKSVYEAWSWRCAHQAHKSTTISYFQVIFRMTSNEIALKFLFRGTYQGDILLFSNHVLKNSKGGAEHTKVFRLLKSGVSNKTTTSSTFISFVLPLYTIADTSLTYIYFFTLCSFISKHSFLLKHTRYTRAILEMMSNTVYT